MGNASIHYTDETYGTKTACGRDIQRVACWDDADAITCGHCRKKLERRQLDADLQKIATDFVAKLDAENPLPAAQQCDGCGRFFDAVGLEQHSCPQATADTQELPHETATKVDAPAESPVTSWTTLTGRGKRITQLANGLDAAHHSALSRLDYATTILEEAELARAALVELARADGHSWTKIGQSIGLTKQAAQQRYGKKPAKPQHDPAQLTIEGA